MVPFTPCTFVCCGVKSLVRITPCTCVQIHDPIYTLCLCLLWGQMNDPRIYTLYVCLLCGQCIGPIYTLYWPRVESGQLPHFMRTEPLMQVNLIAPHYMSS